MTTLATTDKSTEDAIAPMAPAPIRVAVRGMAALVLNGLPSTQKYKNVVSSRGVNETREIWDVLLMMVGVPRGVFPETCAVPAPGVPVTVITVTSGMEMVEEREGSEVSVEVEGEADNEEPEEPPAALDN